MRTTLTIDDNLLERARQLTGIQEKTALVRAGLEALGGTQPKLAGIPWRRSA